MGFQRAMSAAQGGGAHRPAAADSSHRHAMCTGFSHLTNLNKAKRDPAVVERELIKARIHLHSCCHLNRKQTVRGAYFLHEDPAPALKWKEELFFDMRPTPERFDNQGQLKSEQLPAMKTTRVILSSPQIIAQLGRRCDRSHQLASGRPRTLSRLCDKGDVETRGSFMP